MTYEQVKALEKISTCDLVKVLQGREGVKTAIVEPYEYAGVNVDGPSIILIIND